MRANQNLSRALAARCVWFRGRACRCLPDKRASPAGRKGACSPGERAGSRGFMAPHTWLRHPGENSPAHLLPGPSSSRLDVTLFFMQDGLPPPARLRAMFVIVMGIAMSVLDSTIVNLALPGIARDLQASAAQSVVVATASVAGPSVSAVILSLGPWPWLFALNLPLGLLVLGMGYAALPQNATVRPHGAGLSWPDVLMNVLMFGLVFLGADMLGTSVGAAPTAAGLATALALLAAGIAVGGVYLRRQWVLPVPLFPVDLLRIPVFRLSMCTSVGAFAAQMLAYVGLPFFLLDGLGRSPVEAGLLITAWPLGTVVAAPLAGRLIGRYPDGLLGGIGLGLFALGLG